MVYQTWVEAARKFSDPVNKFAAKLIAMGKIDAIDFHLYAGRIYGYPICCIRNYIYIKEILCQGPAGYMYRVHNHRHDLQIVLCNECHAVYQRYVGNNDDKCFY